MKYILYATQTIIYAMQLAKLLVGTCYLMFSGAMSFHMIWRFHHASDIEKHLILPANFLLTTSAVHVGTWMFT
jgi:hypothetical protein